MFSTKSSLRHNLSGIGDTSSLANISSEDAVEAAWNLVVRLICEGRIKTVPFVMDELERVDPQAYQRVNPYRDELVVRNTPEILLEAGRITRKYPNMSRARGRYDIADPWVIAVGKLHGYTVVTDEGLKRRKMPRVCEKEGIASKKLSQMLKEEQE